MSPCNITPAYCAAAAALHETSFDFPWDEKSFADLLALPTTIGWIDERGLLLCSEIADEMEILTLCTHPDSRRQGVADAFLNVLKTYASERGVTRIFLEVSGLNTAAQKLYAKHGFSEIGRRKNYYKTHAGLVDAVCMECGLKKY